MEYGWFMLDCCLIFCCCFNKWYYFYFCFIFFNVAESGLMTNTNAKERNIKQIIRFYGSYFPSFFYILFVFILFYLFIFCLVGNILHDNINTLFVLCFVVPRLHVKSDLKSTFHRCCCCCWRHLKYKWQKNRNKIE